MLAQVLAIIIFLAMFLLIILEIWERQWITLACGLLTLLLVFGLGMHSMGAIMRTLNLQSFFTTGFWYAAGESSEASSGINWQTIIFIAGMMIMVEGMAKVGFFRWLCMEIAKMVKYQVIPIFMTFMLLSFVLAMFIDSITVILFLAAVTIELSQLLEFMFVHGVRVCASFIALHAAVQVSQQCLLNRLSFSHLMFLPPLSKIN